MHGLSGLQIYREYIANMGLLDENLKIKGCQIDWDKIAPDSYLRQIESISGMDSLSFHKPITFFVGENGSGKSTLLEAIAVAYGFNPAGGTKNYSFSTYDSHSGLYEAIRLIKGFKSAGWGYFLRAESFYNVATAEEEYSRIGGRPQFLHMQSHGESFLETAQENFKPNGIYLLDEPEAALSPQRQLTLLLEIANCAKEESQFIIVTHSPILLSIPEAEILSFDHGTVHPIAYEETESYQITKMFINNKDQIIKRLLGSDDT